jgi:DNA invertase Pin-like site-specific DNA recombinase
LPDRANTSTPAVRAMFQMLGVFAEFERSMRVKAGMTRARVSGMKTGAGRKKGEARALLRGGHSEREVARLVGIGKARSASAGERRQPFGRKKSVCHDG